MKLNIVLAIFFAFITTIANVHNMNIDADKYNCKSYSIEISDDNLESSDIDKTSKIVYIDIDLKIKSYTKEIENQKSLTTNLQRAPPKLS
jgi:hypothetical protein